MNHPASDALPNFTRLLACIQREIGDDGLDYADPPALLPGGSDARCYRFSLTSAPGSPQQTLVLRLYVDSSGKNRVIKESLVQTALARQDYPAPRAHMMCTDARVLGGAFLIMDFMPGEIMLRAMRPGAVPGVLAQAHAALHGLDPEPVIEALRGEWGPGADHYRFGNELAVLDKRIDKYPRLRPAVDWLFANRPPEPGGGSICHGDFHPLNLLALNGEVTGVLDWSGLLIADPALDVACTAMLAAVFGSLYLPQAESGREMEARYLAAYRRLRPLDGARLDYYRVWRSVVGLADAAANQKLWRDARVVQTLAAEVERLTGIAVSDS